VFRFFRWNLRDWKLGNTMKKTRKKGLWGRRDGILNRGSGVILSRWRHTARRTS
jgi:hypothetical protein